MPIKVQEIAAAAALAIVLLATVASGHGGPLHPWSMGDAAHNFIRYPLATCNGSAFQPYIYGGGETGPTAGALPAFNTDNSTVVNVTGVATLWLYLDQNCSDTPTSAMGAKLNLTYEDGSAYAVRNTWAYSFTGNCSAPNDFYRNNISNGDNRFNLLWWYGATNINGSLVGTAPNTFITQGPNQNRTANSTATTPPLSIILVPNPADSPTLCCNWVYNAPPPATFLKSGKICRSPPPPPPAPKPPPPSPKHSSPPPKKSTGRRMTEYQ